MTKHVNSNIIVLKFLNYPQALKPAPLRVSLAINDPSMLTIRLAPFKFTKCVDFELCFMAHQHKRLGLILACTWSLIPGGSYPYKLSS